MCWYLWLNMYITIYYNIHDFSSCLKIVFVKYLINLKTKTQLKLIGVVGNSVINHFLFQIILSLLLNVHYFAKSSCSPALTHS